MSELCLDPLKLRELEKGLKNWTYVWLMLDHKVKLSKIILQLVMVHVLFAVVHFMFGTFFWRLYRWLISAVVILSFLLCFGSRDEVRWKRSWPWGIIFSIGFSCSLISISCKKQFVAVTFLSLVWFVLKIEFEKILKLQMKWVEWFIIFFLL